MHTDVVVRGDPRAAFGLRSLSVDPLLAELYDLIGKIEDPDAQSTLSRIAKERLCSVFSSGDAASSGVVELNNGLHIEVDLADIFGAIFYSGHCAEAFILDCLLQTIAEGAVVVDVGANFGLYSLHTANVGCRTIAFEPVPATAQLLRNNIERNTLGDRLTLIERAVSEGIGEAAFFVATDASFSGLRDTQRSNLAEKLTVPTTDLDSSLGELGVDQLNFLKIDVEGAEWRVLEGAWGSLARSEDVIVLMEYSFKNLSFDDLHSTKMCIDKFCDLGFLLYGLDGLPVSISAIKSSNDMGPDFNGSLVAVKKGGAFGTAFIDALRARLSQDVRLNIASAAITHVLLQFREKENGERQSQKELSRAKVALAKAKSNFERSQQQVGDLQESVSQFKQIAKKGEDRFKEIVQKIDKQDKKIEAQRAIIAGGNLEGIANNLQALCTQLSDRLEASEKFGAILAVAIEEIGARIEEIGVRHEGFAQNIRSVERKLVVLDDAVEALTKDFGAQQQDLAKGLGAQQDAVEALAKDFGAQQQDLANDLRAQQQDLDKGLGAQQDAVEALAKDLGVRQRNIVNEVRDNEIKRGKQLGALIDRLDALDLVVASLGDETDAHRQVLKIVKREAARLQLP